VSQVVRSRGDKPEAGGAPPRASTRPAYGAGSVIADKYELVNLLDEGGMGSLWVARNLALDAQVVLKLIRTDLATPGADERFLTEARAAARLKHPSITRVFDFGKVDGDPFIVMELLSGENFGDFLERNGTLSAIDAVQILLPIADGLVAAHSKGVVHRDLKPDNVFLADVDGRLQPKLLDFGIARLAENVAGDHRITQAGTVVGSPNYMAPEQARGMPDIDQRADLWAFCVMLLECITGELPFQDDNYNALLRHIIEDELPRPDAVYRNEPELWAILSRGLEKDRARRYHNMRELGEELARWLVARGVSDDASGHSLRAAWLDPMASAGRVSLVSISGNFPASSLRFTPGEGHLAPLLHTPSGGAAPITLPAPPPIEKKSRTKIHLLVGAGLVLLAAAGFAVVTAVSSRTPADFRAPAANRSALETPARAAPAETPTAEALPSASASAPPDSGPSESPRGTAKKTQRDQPARPERPRVKETSPAAPATGTQKKAYGEDLGF
jgi:eukaryotic-like serine/threonine-protein kinase